MNNTRFHPPDVHVHSPQFLPPFILRRRVARVRPSSAPAFFRFFTALAIEGLVRSRFFAFAFAIFIPVFLWPPSRADVVPLPSVHAVI
jgi:hypothetical protein